MKRIGCYIVILLFLSMGLAWALMPSIPSSTVSASTTTSSGTVELATDAETVTGTSDSVVCTPGNVTAKMAAPGAIGGTTPGAGNFTSLTGKRTASATDYNPSALTSDYIIAITNTDSARAVTISIEDEDSGTTSQPRIIIIKDESGGASGHNITVSLESGGNIDGSANYVINQNYQSIVLYIDGVNAWIY